MTLYVILGLATAGVMWFVLAPMVRDQRAALGRAVYDFAIYRQQLRDLDKDAAAHLISREDAAAARLEIERRMLAADRQQASSVLGVSVGPVGAGSVGRQRWLVAGALAAFIGLGAGGLYGLIGRPDLPDRPLAARLAALAQTDNSERVAGEDDFTVLVEKLAKRMAAHPEDPEGWRLLGRSYAGLGRFDEAAEAFARAALIEEGRGPDKVQNEAIRAMVDGLAQRLEAQPRDEQGWVRLMRSRMVLGQKAAARAALTRALAAFADEPATQARLTGEAQALGFDADTGG